MGVTSQFDNLEFRNAMESIKRKTELANIPCGVHVVAPSANELQERMTEGYRFIAYSMDSVFLNHSSNNPVA